jgi:hypothetical protein
MNRVRQLCAVTLLTVVLPTSSALAGDMPLGISSPPPSPTEHVIAGQMPCGITSSSPSSDASLTGNMPQGIVSGIDPVTESMLGLLQSVLALF